MNNRLLLSVNAHRGPHSTLNACGIGVEESAIIWPNGARFPSMDHFVVTLVFAEPGARCQICVCPNNGMPMYG